MNKWSIAARRIARRFALQALYQWEFNPTSAKELITIFLAQPEMVNADADFFAHLVQGVMSQHRSLDTNIEPFLLKSHSTTQPVERAILRIGAYEIHNYVETPYRVIVNEAIELAKAFGASGSYKYVNGILRGLAQTCRPDEFSTS